jgi:hypothetical protein
MEERGEGNEATKLGEEAALELENGNQVEDGGPIGREESEYRYTSRAQMTAKRAIGERRGK